MSYKFVVPIMLSLSLGGCIWTVHNSDEAYEVLPTLPEKPDGICPDVKGVYPSFVWSEATKYCRDKFF
ncbi:hypothetical protein FACS1894154_05380 [Betaproteobacteria bacterium]|nr:hypothetical protein FACS1894154_05380 [Betaproteobacteria bacterium]GHU24879.1 hypothetical protein FACS189488_10500 [Betaproteobacteria bacterium]